MSTLLAVGLIGSGAAGLVHALGRSADSGWSVAQRDVGVMGRRHRVTLIEAAGLVHGTNRELICLARRQWQATMVLAVVAALAVLSAPSSVTVAASVSMIALGWKGPLIVARRREADRRRRVDLELVDALGEMVMGVEVGLTLDAVMLRYADRRATPLGDEFRHTLDLIQLGSRRAEAMVVLADRNPTGIMRLFVAVVVQNQELGTPLAAALRQQAVTARRQRRQAVEEQAAKVPLKMIFPTVFCVLPVLMVVIVGPAVIRLMEVLP